MKVSEVMTGDVTLVNVDTLVADVARIMLEENTGCVAVTDGDSLAGMITERDMVLGCLIDGHVSWNCEAFRHMTILEHAGTPEMDVGDALLSMMDMEVSCMPVVAQNGRLIGMVHSEDLTRAIAEENEPQPTLMHANLYS